MASTSRNRARYVFARRPDGTLNSEALPRLSVHDGRLSWQLPESVTRTVAEQRLPAEPSAAARWSAAEEALIAANRARIEQLKTLPQGVDEPDLGLMLHLVARHAAPDVALSVAGLALSAAGLVPLRLWEAAITTIAGSAALAVRLSHRHHLASAGEGAQTADQLWKVHPDYVMAMLTNMLQATLAAASIDDTELEDQLDHFYPRWSRTDFEFDLRRFTA